MIKKIIYINRKLRFEDSIRCNINSSQLLILRLGFFKPDSILKTCRVLLTFKSVDEILWCEHMVPFVSQYFMKYMNMKIMYSFNQNHEMLFSCLLTSLLNFLRRIFQKILDVIDIKLIDVKKSTS